MLSKPTHKKSLLSLLLLIVAVLAVTPIVDQRASAEYEKLFERAFITFALARTINGVISAVQGTEVALQPAGVGVTLTPGEILDPVNDLVERFSWIMMGATVSLGIQSVLLEISAWWPVQVLLVVFIAWTALRLWQPGPDRQVSGVFLRRALLVLLFVRFAVPLMLIANDFVYQQFLESRYLQSSQVITTAGEDLERLSVAAREDAVESGEPGWLDSISQAWSDTVESMDISGKLDRMQSRAGEVVEHLVQLSVIFILQTGLLPIPFLWVLLHFFKRLFRPD